MGKKGIGEHQENVKSVNPKILKNTQRKVLDSESLLKNLKVGQQITVLKQPLKKKCNVIIGIVSHKSNNMLILATENYRESFSVKDLIDNTIRIEVAI